MVDFKKLKSLSGSASLEKLTAELQKLNSRTITKDERLWYPAVDKAGNGQATIRFLPAADQEDESDPSFIRVFEHSFQGPTGSWYFENSLTTLSKQDPVSEYNTKLWNTGLESDKDLARKYKRNLRFITNILVIDDDAHPENNGKVKLFKFGKKIFEHLEEAMVPTVKGETPFSPWHLWEGANFILNIRNVDGYRNYGKSKFGRQSPLASDEEMEAICQQLYPLKPFLAADQFKSYDELKAKFEKVIGLGETVHVARKAAALLTDEDTASVTMPTRLATTKPPTIVEEDADDETAKWFESLNDDE